LARASLGPAKRKSSKQNISVNNAPKSGLRALRGPGVLDGTVATIPQANGGRGKNARKALLSGASSCPIKKETSEKNEAKKTWARNDHGIHAGSTALVPKVPISLHDDDLTINTTDTNIQAQGADRENLPQSHYCHNVLLAQQKEKDLTKTMQSINKSKIPMEHVQLPQQQLE